MSYLLVNEADIRWWQRGDPEGRLSRGKLAFDRLTARLEVVYRDGPLDAPRIIYRVLPFLNDDDGRGARFR